MTVIKSYQDLLRKHEASGFGRKVKGTRKFSSYSYSRLDPTTGTIEIGYANYEATVAGQVAPPYHYVFRPWLTVTKEGLMTSKVLNLDFRVAALFGLHCVKSRTIKRKGYEYTDLLTPGAPKFWQTEPLVFDMTTRKSQNEDFTELTWDKEKSREFNRWMRGLKQQFIVRARLGTLISPQSAPHFFAKKNANRYYHFWHWDSLHLKDPLKAFQAVQFDDPRELIPFTKKMRSQISNTDVHAAFPPDHQVAEIERIFRVNRQRLQEQYGARQYTCSTP